MAIDVLNVRSGPGVTHEVIGLIAPGEVYRHHGDQDGWYRIRHQGREGLRLGGLCRARRRLTGHRLLKSEVNESGKSG